MINDKNSNDGHSADVFEDKDGKFRYRIGIIDFLTSYTAAKRLETGFN